MEEEQNPTKPNFGWVMTMRGPDAERMVATRPNLHRFLHLTALRTLWRCPEGNVKVGEALMNPRICGMNRQEFRSALGAAQAGNYVTIIGTNRGARNPQGTIVKFTDTSCYDVRIVTENRVTQKGTVDGTVDGTTNGKKGTVQGTTKGTIEEPLRYADKNGAGTAQSHVNEDAETLQGTENSANATLQATKNGKNGTFQGAVEGACFLKKEEKIKEKEERNQEKAAAPPARSGSSFSGTPESGPDGPDQGQDPDPDQGQDPDPDQDQERDPVGMAKELSIDYPIMVDAITKEFTKLTSSGFEAAVEFFDYCTGWSSIDVIYVGYLALMATKNRPGANDKFWWSRKYANDVTRLMMRTQEERDPVLYMAKEVGYDPRHYSEDELMAKLKDELFPYVEARAQEKKARRS